MQQVDNQHRLRPTPTQQTQNPFTFGQIPQEVTVRKTSAPPASRAVLTQVQYKPETTKSELLLSSLLLYAGNTVDDVPRSRAGHGEEALREFHLVGRHADGGDCSRIAADCHVTAYHFISPIYQDQPP